MSAPVLSQNNPKPISPNYALFISPDLKIYNVNSTHISLVINNPSLFGLTSEFITDTYTKYKEPLYLEGLGRKEIIRLLVTKGWYHIRRNVKAGYTANIARYNPISLKVLCQLSSSLLSAGCFGMIETDHHITMKINVLSEGKFFSMSLQKLSVINKFLCDHDAFSLREINL